MEDSFADQPEVLYWLQDAFQIQTNLPVEIELQGIPLFRAKDEIIFTFLFKNIHANSTYFISIKSDTKGALPKEDTIQSGEVNYVIKIINLGKSKGTRKELSSLEVSLYSDATKVQRDFPLF
jgi:hypothetical protein